MHIDLIQEYFISDKFHQKIVNERPPLLKRKKSTSTENRIEVADKASVKEQIAELWSEEAKHILPNSKLPRPKKPRQRYRRKIM